MTIIKEIISALVSCLVVMIALGVGFYRFIPNNKVIPETISYKQSDEIKGELKTEVNTNSDNIIKTYEITTSDMEKFQAAKEYVPGKKNPFAPVDLNSVDNDDDDLDSTGSSNSSSSSSGTTSSGGSLFEKPGTK